MKNYVITLISNPATHPLTQSDVTNISKDLEVTQTKWLSDSEACDIFIHAEQQPRLTSDLFDIIVQPTKSRQKKLLICDMDSTIIEQECIDELADKVGLKAQVEKITERAMRGELDFNDALRTRVALLRGLPIAALQNVFDEQITFMPGAKELVATMRNQGAHCMLVSGGFTFFTSRVADAIGFHEHRANRLCEGQDALSGHVEEPILGKDAKREALLETVKKLELDISQTVAIGDGANDLPMLQTAGLGIAYHAKPIVQASTNATLNHSNLRGALFAQGISSDSFKYTL